MYILGIDIGTEGLRVALIDLKGRQISTAASSYATTYPHPSWAEQNPEDWWEAASRAIPLCLNQAGVKPDQILAIGLDAFVSTMVACDLDGKPLAPAILWMDVRASKEAADIENTGDPVLRYGGGKESAEWMLSRILWLKRNRPEVYHKAPRIVEALDWFTFRLTGTWCLSMNPITNQWHYVPSRGGWPVSLLDAIGLQEVISKWPEKIYAIGDHVGEVTGEAAKTLGLKAGIPVACGGVDAHVGILGLNAVQPGQMGLIIGSSSVQVTLSPDPVFNPGMWGPFEDSIIKGTWMLECGQISTGSILNWYVHNMVTRELTEAAMSKGLSIYAYLDRLADPIQPGSNGLIALDYWQGNRTPIRDAAARGALLGLSLYHTPAHIYRAFLEAVSFGNYHIVETFREAGVEIKEINVSGGGAKSDTWIQMHADVCNMPITVTSSSDAMLTGCAIAGAVCAGVYGDIREAAAEMVKPTKRFEPDSTKHTTYMDVFRDYVDLYPAIRSIQHRLSTRAKVG